LSKKKQAASKWLGFLVNVLFWSQCERYEREDNADWRPKGRRDKVRRPQGMNREADCDRAKVDERRTNEPEVCDIGLRGLRTVAS
jgi:hypothetical protein